MIDQFSDLLAQISSAEINRSAALCSRLADRFEDDLLEYEEFPDTHLDFFLTLLSDHRFYTRPGVWNFILAVNNAKDALSTAQYQRISTAFELNFVRYEDRDLCLAVCDFIARNFDLVRAKELLQNLKKIESQKGLDLQGFADEGLFILNRELTRVAESNIKRH